MKREKILAIDFDGVIWDQKNKILISDCEDALNKLKRAGFTLVLWTCRNGNRLTNAKNILKKHNLYDLFSSFNENPSGLKLKYKTPNKLLASVYIDDRNIGGFMGWEKVLNYLIE